MDAKPQRPRALRIFDENAMPPPVLPGKTLHHRTKSVPAFSSAHSGAVKAMAAAAAATAANKKVLGEVNANTKLAQPSKDDSIIGKKVVNVDFVKPFVPIARPVARPATAKSFSAYNAPTITASKDQSIAPQQEPAKKLTVKKSTKVLRDPETADVDITCGLSDVALEAHVDELPLVAAPVSAPVQSVVVERAITQDLMVLNNDLQVVEIPTQQELTTAVHALDQPPKEHNNHLVHSAEVLAQNLAAPTADLVSPNGLKSHVEVKVLPQLVPEPMHAEPYYDEEDTHYYEDDDCTTQQSFGLRGESIGGVTTVLVPKQSEKAREEIRVAKMVVEDSRTVEDIDDEEWDTSMVAEYSEEIFEYMRKLESRMVPNPRYMDQQTEIQWSMRSVLVDWVVQVHQRFNLLPETLFLSINYIDRFLTHKVVSLGKLQLVGATALFIAAKFEEVNCPTLQEIIFMVDGGYTMDELLKAERFMLSMLQFDLGWPGPMSFLRRISKADDYDLETRTLAKYFLEVTLMDERFVGCTPSFLAAGAHCMARLMLRKGEWTTAHVAYSEYTFNQLRNLLNGILECCVNPQKHHLSVYEKYTDKRYKRASTFVEAEMCKGFSLHPQALRASLAMPLMH